MCAREEPVRSPSGRWGCSPGGSGEELQETSLACQRASIGRSHSYESKAALEKCSATARRHIRCFGIARIGL
jgi:hypothetical protein